MGVVFSLFSQSKGQDRLSALPDDVLLCILVRVDDLSTVVRTSVLSTRWRRLPWLLPELNIDVEDFISVPHQEPIGTNIIPEPNEANVNHDAMLTVTTAIKCLFAKPPRESIVTRLRLKLYLIDTFSCHIGPLVCDTIDCGLLKDLELAILDEKRPSKCSDSYMLKRAQDMDGFFRAYPSVLHCLTRLSMYHVSFALVDMHHVLFDCCKQLNHLTLYFCDAGPHSIWKIDAPNSKLRVLDLQMCCFERVELISLPKLEKLQRLAWTSNNPPLSFGCVPSLKELDLSNCLFPDQHLLKLSELLHGTAGIQTLRLDFIGNTIWLQSEIKQLAYAFRRLRKLFILRVFVEFDLLWTTAFLEASPSVEIFHIKVYEPCEMEHEPSPWPDHTRTNPDWELNLRGSKNLVLRELHIDCFRPLEQQLTCIRSILERAPNLLMVVLCEDDEECDECDSPPSVSPRPAFPENKEEQDMVVRRVTDCTSFSGRIIFQ